MNDGLTTLGDDMSKVYVVTEGEYSDYRIVGVFSTEEEARKICSLLSDESADVEEYELDTIQPIPDGYHLFRISMTETGDMTYIARDNRKRVFMPDTIDFGRYEDGPYYAWLVAKDEKHATKIMAEKVAEAEYERGHLTTL